MAHFVLMPQLGVSEESGLVAAWHVKTGDTVKTGDSLFALETGKTSFDVEADADGTILALLYDEGDEVQIKKPVCVIGVPGEHYDLPTGAPATTAQEPEPAHDDMAKAEPAPAKKSAVYSDLAPISPRARALADKAGVASQLAEPSGPEGRIIERDVLALIAQKDAALNQDREEFIFPTPSADTLPVAESVAALVEEAVPAEDVSAPSQPVLESAPVAAPAAVPAYEDKPLSPIRKLIAKNMHASLSGMAQLTHNASFDAAALLSFRALCKQSDDTAGITLTDMILFAVTRTLPDFPELNAWFLEGSMRYFSGVHLACAVDTPRGLMVPVLFDADRMTLSQLSARIKVLAVECQSGKIASELLEGGSFTVSNLGAYGVESFTPIINPPQTGILGVCTTVPRVREKDGVLSTYLSMTLSLTYDHRALDGAPASRFLQAVCKRLERFPLTLAF